LTNKHTPDPSNNKKRFKKPVIWQTFQRIKAYGRTTLPPTAARIGRINTVKNTNQHKNIEIVTVTYIVHM
jgi:hypothetical protein